MGTAGVVGLGAGSSREGFARRVVVVAHVSPGLQVAPWRLLCARPAR